MEAFSTVGRKNDVVSSDSCEDSGSHEGLGRRDEVHYGDGSRGRISIDRYSFEMNVVVVLRSYSVIMSLLELYCPLKSRMETGYRTAAN